MMCAAFAEDQGSVKSEDSSTSRAKLLCSYGGRIMPRPHDAQLRYVGGETRILSVHRNISVADLMAKLRKICTYENFIVKYQLPNEDLDALVSIISEEDLENMMEEFDRIESKDSSSRLRLFIFPASAKQAPSHENAANSEHKFLEALNGVYRKVNVAPEVSVDEQQRRQPVTLVDKATVVAPLQLATTALPQTVQPQALKVPAQIVAAAAAVQQAPVQTVVPPASTSVPAPTPALVAVPHPVPATAPTPRVGVHTLASPLAAIPPSVQAVVPAAPVAAVAAVAPSVQAVVPPAPLAAIPPSVQAAVPPTRVAASPFVTNVVPPLVTPQVLPTTPVNVVAVPPKHLTGATTLRPGIPHGGQAGAPVFVAARSLVPQAMASSRVIPASTYVPLVEASKGMLPKGMVMRHYSVEDDHDSVSSQASSNQVSDVGLVNLDGRGSAETGEDRHRVLDAPLPDLERLKVAENPRVPHIPRSEVLDVHGFPHRQVVVAGNLPEQQTVEGLLRPQAYAAAGHQFYVVSSDALHNKIVSTPAAATARHPQENNGGYPVFHPANVHKQPPHQVANDAGALQVDAAASQLVQKPLVQNVLPQLVAANPFRSP